MTVSLPLSVFTRRINESIALELLHTMHGIVFHYFNSIVPLVSDSSRLDFNAMSRIQPLTLFTPPPHRAHSILIKAGLVSAGKGGGEGTLAPRGVYMSIAAAGAHTGPKISDIPCRVSTHRGGCVQVPPVSSRDYPPISALHPTFLGVVCIKATCRHRSNVSSFSSGGDDDTVGRNGNLASVFD